MKFLTFTEQCQENKNVKKSLSTVEKLYLREEGKGGKSPYHHTALCELTKET